MPLDIRITDTFDRADTSIGLGAIRGVTGIETIGDLVVGQAAAAVGALRRRALTETRVYAYGFLAPAGRAAGDRILRSRPQIRRGDAYFTPSAFPASIAHINAFTANVQVDLQFTIGGGTQCIYFRYRDGRNWWRVRTVDTYWTRSPVYAAVLERCLNGRITAIGSTGNLRGKGTLSALRVRALGTQIEAYTNLSSTPFWRVLDSRLSDATRHGFGRGGPRGETERDTGPIRTFALRSLNAAPSAPVLEYPRAGYAIDIERPTQFRWKHVDPDARDGQTGAQLRFRRAGETSWETVDRVGPAGAYTAPAGMFSTGSYQWTVRTRDSRGAWGPFATPVVVNMGDLPTDVVIVDPPPGDRLTSPMFTVTWATGAQDGYEVRVLGETGLGLPDESKLLRPPVRVLMAAARSHTLSWPVTGAVLHVQVRTVLRGLWSPWASSRVVTGFTPPMRPQVELDVDSPPSAITVRHEVPPAQRGAPDTTHVRILRTVRDDPAPPVLVADTWPPNEPFADFTIRSGVDYGYTVEAVSVTGSTAASATRFDNPEPGSGHTPGTVAATVTATV